MELARRVSLRTWLRDAPDGSPGPCADALTSDLTTSSDKQSWWVADDSRDEIAIAIASTRDTLSNVDLAILATEEIESLAISWERTRGETPYALANELHCDLLNLSAQALGRLADRVHARREAIERIRQSTVRDLLVAAIGRGQLDPAQLRPQLLISLAKRLCTMQQPDDAALAAVIREVRNRETAGTLDPEALDPRVRARMIELDTPADRESATRH